jgi:hypothetical protein
MLPNGGFPPIKLISEKNDKKVNIKERGAKSSINKNINIRDILVNKSNESEKQIKTNEINVITDL